MSLRRRTAPPPALAPAMRHYLEKGCWRGVGAQDDEAFDVFLLSAGVLRNDLTGLRAVWRDLGAFVKAQHPAETFAEVVLEARDWRQWALAGRWGRTACPAHPLEAA